MRIGPELLDPARYPFGIEISTRFADLDPNDHINNVAMAAAFEDARVRFDMSVDYAILSVGTRTVVASSYIDYLAEAHYPEPLMVRIGVTAIGRTSWAVSELALQQGIPRAACRATLVGIGPNGPTPLSDLLRLRLAAVMIRVD